MNRLFHLLWAGALISGLAACQGRQATGVHVPNETPRASQTTGAPVAYLAGQAIYTKDLQPGLIEAAGGTVLADWVLDRMLAKRLKQRGLAVTQTLVDAEKQRMLQALDNTDPQQAMRLLLELRRQRGLAEHRFTQLLWRNAALRLLVADQVQISPAAVQQQYTLQYGPRYQGRILVVPTLKQTTALRKQILAGAAFSDLAAVHSTDISARQGGLLSPISPADATYPQTIRDALVKLQPGAISPAIALDQGYALVTLVKRIDADPTSFEQVADTLRKQVREKAESLLSKQLAQTLLAEADLVVLDPTLSAGWRERIDNF